MNLLFRAREWSRHRLQAGNEHDIHSPFVYELYTNVLKDETPYYSFDRIEAVRSLMKLSQEKISVHDFGTGGSESKSRILTQSYIVKHYVKPKKYGQMLFRLVNYLQPKRILELGTSLGITTLYLAAADTQSQVLTLEGCPNTASSAIRNFKHARISNIEVIVGDFEKSLPLALKKMPAPGFVYFDGNHRREATLRYFQSCLNGVQDQSVFVFDDIYWSPGMAAAWDEIKHHPAVTISIDLYSIGIVFFRQGQVKQQFRLRF